MWNLPIGGIASSTSPGASVLVGPGREGAAIDALDADLEAALVQPGADRIGASQLLAVEFAAEGQVLALGEAKRIGVGACGCEGQHHGIAGLAADVGDGQGMEARHRVVLPLRCT